MRFHHLDLNLLVALDVLLEEQNITRAAERLHMTQSATSGVLARLRTYFEDDLLVQVGRKMMPTALALDLEQPVREVLMTIQSSITAKPMLDPSTSKRHLRFAASDYVISVLLSDAIRHINAQAPQVTFEMVALSEQTFQALNRGQVDLLVIPDHYLPDDQPSQVLFEEDHVCVVWQENELVSDEISVEQYLEMGHVAVSFGRTRQLAVEEWFMKQYNCQRRIEVITHDFNTLPQLVIGTQRVATMHRRLARLYTERWPLRMLPTPVPTPTIKEYLVWHRSMDRDPMLRWVREQIFQVAQVLSPELERPLAETA
ncbi:LysR family transcriptional regulator [Stutzerimonas stutzeri]|uniref:LysR family transcriptional regulator n=1 Tax=Stutzerimonas stutzeri TaxID=316 RepID=UPI00210E52E7|nr:LysR family transcriptional regulator [Stutzerimonas stutzeri]MCQ4260587.1 LysR family transcriptional regulator [Stutzerimonas stutzeri]